jgi:hypothetical protein
MLTGMSRLALGLTVSLGLFALCCYLFADWSDLISQSPVATYLLLGLTAVTLLTWPLFAVRLLSTAIRRRSGL